MVGSALIQEREERYILMIPCLATPIVVWIAGVGAVGGTLGTLVLVFLAWKRYRQVGRVD